MWSTKWVSRLVLQDSFHARSCAWLAEQRANNIDLLAPALLLAEVSGAITRRTLVTVFDPRSLIIMMVAELSLLEQGQTEEGDTGNACACQMVSKGTS